MADDDSYTLARYLATGGYEGLRKALTMTPEQVHDEVNTASLLGRGGAGFPAGRSGRCCGAAATTYLVVNGDESEPATFKDHMLIERDPHQIIEGTIIAAYAIGAAAAFIYCRGEFALGLERLAAGAATMPTQHGAFGREHLRVGFLPRPRHPPRRRRLHLRRRDGAAREPRRQTGLPPHQAALLPGRHRPLRRADDRQQRRDDGEPALDRRSTAASAFAAPRAGTVRPVRGCSPCPATWSVPAVRDRDVQDDLPRPHLRPALGGGIRGGRELKAFIPGGVSAPWFGPEHLDLGLDQDAVGKAGSMLGSGSIVVMDETTCVVRAAWRITRFFQRESCGQCTPCREGSGWLEKILRRIEDGYGREEDLDLLMDVCDNIAPGLGWPPPQTTICVLGPSIPSSIASAHHACSATSSSCTSRRVAAPCRAR